MKTRLSIEFWVSVVVTLLMALALALALALVAVELIDRNNGAWLVPVGAAMAVLTELFRRGIWSRIYLRLEDSGPYPPSEK